MSWKPDWKLPGSALRSVREKAPETAAENNEIDQIVVRQVTADDLIGLEWDGEYRHFRRVYAEAFQRMQRGFSILWIAELSGKGIVGQVFIQFICDRHELADGMQRAYLYSFRVRNTYRGQGIGTRIMDVVEDDLRERGFHYVTLNVARDNPRAQRLYVRRGYHVVAPEAGIWSYLDDQGIWRQVEEPAWRMEKEL
jgi:ribosomal protein S18 acetylase RimI-like enzyme